MHLSLSLSIFCLSFAILHTTTFACWDTISILESNSLNIAPNPSPGSSREFGARYDYSGNTDHLVHVEYDEDDDGDYVPYGSQHGSQSSHRSSTCELHCTISLYARAGGPKPPNKPPGTKAREKALSGYPKLAKEHYEAARMAYLRTKHLPHRDMVFRAPGDKVVTGKNVRTAVFNTHLYKGHLGTAAKIFYNRLQVEGEDPPKKPLPHMHGKGVEYPVVAGHKNGYHGHDDKGTIRSITKSDGAGGHSFEGVIAHKPDRTRDHSHYNHHYHVPGNTPARAEPGALPF